VNSPHVTVDATPRLGVLLRSSRRLLEFVVLFFVDFSTTAIPRSFQIVDWCAEFDLDRPESIAMSGRKTDG
jgi:hypothetical protein